MAKVPKKYKKVIAPRLANEERRVSCGHGLPPNVKIALQMIAYDRGQSLSWVLEQALIDRFKVERPEYIPRKKQEDGV